MKIKKLAAAALALLMAACPMLTGCGTGEIMKVNDNSPDDIQYMIFQLTNTHWEEAEYYIQEMKVLYGENDPSTKRVYGVGLMGPMLLNQSIEQMQACINAGFDYAEKYNIPIYFQLDDQNNYTSYFGNDTDIKFWEDPSMCEWVAFPEEGEDYGGQQYGEIPRFWYNWGIWRYAPAAPNFESPKYKALIERNMREGVLKPLLARYDKLLKAGKGWLFAGLANGWECHIPNLSDPQFSGMFNQTILAPDGEAMQSYERRQFGYNALHTLGYTQKTLRREAETRGMRESDLVIELLCGVIQRHMEVMSKQCYDAGIARHKIFTHIVSLASVRPASTFSPAISASVNPYAIPGFTMSPVSCVFDLDVIEEEIAKVDPDVKEFAVAEGYCAGYREQADAEKYFETFFGGNCRLITCFGYTDSSGTFSYDRSPDFGFVIAVNEWLSGDLLPGFVWADRFNTEG